MDDEQHYIPRSGPMFSRGTTARAELATDLAITLLAEGGWPALTLRNVAIAANVTPQAIAAWFPSVAAMRLAVAERYGQRWVRHLSQRAHRRVPWAGGTDNQVRVSDVVDALLPQTWLEETFDGIWLTVIEAGRWDPAIASSVVSAREREREEVLDLLDPSQARHDVALEHEADLVLVLWHGLRESLAQPRPAREAGRSPHELLERLAAAG